MWRGSWSEHWGAPEALVWMRMTLYFTKSCWHTTIGRCPTAFEPILPVKMIRRRAMWWRADCYGLIGQSSQDLGTQKCLSHIYWPSVWKFWLWSTYELYIVEERSFLQSDHTMWRRRVDMISTVGPLAVALYIICELNTINVTPDNHSCSTTCPEVPYSQYEVPFWMCIIDRSTDCMCVV